jgi:hypothetical protein
MNATPLFLAFVLLIYTAFNGIFITGFFKTGYKLGMPFLRFGIATLLLVFAGEALHFFPGLAFFNAPGGERLGLQLGVLAVAAVVFLFAEPLFVLLFGGQWVGTGYYVRCLLPWMSILVISNSLSFISSIFGTQRVDFILQVVQLLLRAVALYAGIHQGDFQLAVLLFCIVSAVVQAVQLGWYLYQVHRYEQHHTSPCQPPRES